MSIVSELEELTGCCELKEYQKGTSTRKYLGRFENKTVIVRQFVERQYYGNRYQREGFALKFLSENRDKVNFDFPEVILDFPEKSVRVVDWLPGKSLNELVLTPKLQKDIMLKVWDSLSSLPTPQIKTFNLIRDIKLLTEDDSFIVSSAKSFYHMLKEKAWNSFDKSIIKAHPKTLIHGDFFQNNIIVEDPENPSESKIGLIDWEYASVGSKYFDLSYCQAYGNLHFIHENSKEINAWTNLINLLITHWYGTHYDVNPKESKEWLQKILERVT